MRPVREATAALVGVGGGGDQAAPAAAAGHVGHVHPGLWTTPTPYLFLGFAMMMLLIAVALLVLVCTRRKLSSGSSRRGSSGTAESLEASKRGTMAPLDREPKVVVIMAGDHMPSFLASVRPFAFPTVANAEAGEPSKDDAA
jgi:hypothetical protein